ncbi:MAG: acyl-ACP--UDP-N-acetylglucosamine O-acyltransferase [Acidobacteria bacterium]|nr:acyl-ACP--UDP-N-acetylglucosamine O-acyltransferase [Acidobacteriota bacterium]
MNATVDCHPTAVVEPGAELGTGVKVGPYAVIKSTARVGDECEIGAFAVVDEYAVLGTANRLFPHACVGSEPQDLKFEGEVSYLEVGDRNVFREFVTANRGTAGGGGVTRIGSENLFMAYCHVAHDCVVGDHTIFGNAAALAGHVEVGDWAILNAYAAVQQFVRIGAHAYLAGMCGSTRDVVPFSKVHGNPAQIIGLNAIGLQRRGFDSDTRSQLKHAFKLLFRAKLNTTQALDAVAEAGLDGAEVRQLVDFVTGSQLGIVK